jgi:hypothetical protein
MGVMCNIHSNKVFPHFFKINFILSLGLSQPNELNNIIQVHLLFNWILIYSKFVTEQGTKSRPVHNNFQGN